MKTMIVSLIAAFSLSALLLAPSAMARQHVGSNEAPSGEQKKDAQIECLGMMHGAGMTEEGTKAMREFMHSPKAPEAMSNMMEMGRRMGNGDLMLGMTRMMEMMGGPPDMMGGSGPMRQRGMMSGHSGGSK